MEKYFNIRYEFDKHAVFQAIDEALLLKKPGYICVSDGVILATVNRDPDLGTTQPTLDGLKRNLSEIDPRIHDMWFYALPYKPVDEFDYQAIANMLDKDGAEIIWVALGAPKQEIFMSKLKPYLKRGVMIAVGAAFKFYSGTDVNRAPYWMVRAHMEFLYRIYCEPKKQLRRCWLIVESLPKLLFQEWNRKRRRKKLAGTAG